MNTKRTNPTVIGIDIGGTFTDIVTMNSTNGEVHLQKVPTTPQDPSIGFVQGIAQVLNEQEANVGSVSHIFHGTTVATNLILESKGSDLVLITNRGFRHVLEIGRHDIPRKENMFSWVKPKRPVHPKDIYEISGRMNFDGIPLAPISDGEISEIAEKIKASHVRSVAICLLHSYANPEHERQVRSLLLAADPELHISISSEILPVFREYERTMATILNVYVMPAITSYVGKLEDRCSQISLQAPIFLMKSSGGVTSTSSAKREPIQTVLSGPAAGVIGASHAAKLAGYPNVITIDIGGTSADVCVIQQGEHAVTGRGRIGDWPLNTPMIDITTIGAGGGSMARVTPEGQLLVGPASAGSVPGPVCYGKGGEQPTVTDANLVLGRLCPSLLNDDFILDIKSAESAIKRKIAGPLGLTVTQAAQGILDIVDHSMVGALRLVTVERGLDPRDFALLPFGGAGPVHGSSLARLLGINTQVIAAHPGVLSAYGLLNADLRSDFSRTFFCSDPFKSLNDIKQVFSELENQANDWFFRESVPLRQQNRSWAASFRYAHQGFELTVPWDDSKKTVASLENVIHSFHVLHEKLYTFNQLDTPVELVTLHVTATAAFKRPAEQTNAKSSRKPPEILGKQKMYADKKWHVAPIYHRSKLHSGSKFEGPAIIKQLDTTTVVLPGQLVKAHPSGALIIKEV